MATYNLHTCGISIPAPYFQEYVTDKSEVRRYLGMTGEADKAVEALIAGNLDFNPDVQCNHHGDHHHDHDHECGSHGCGEHHCGH